MNDSDDYAQLANNVNEGNGYSTSVLRPLAYRFFKTLPQPEVTRMPGYPFSLALFFKMFGRNDFTVVLFNGVFYMALVILAYLFAYELSCDVFTSLVAAVATALTKGFLMQSLEAEPNVMYSALFVAFCYYYIKNPRRYLAHGIILGVLQLVRANTQFVLLALFFISIFDGSQGIRNRLSGGIKLIAGFLIGITPHLIRNYIIIGNPFFSLYSYSLLLQTKSFPGYTIWNQINEIDPLLFVKTHPWEIISKSFQWLLRLIQSSIQFYSLVVLLLVGGTFFLANENPRIKSLKILIGLSIVVQTLLVLPLGAVPYYYLFFFPLMIIISSINIKEFFEAYGKIALMAAVLVFVYVTIPYWKNPKPINIMPEIGRQVARLSGDNDILLSDIPWELAWYSNRKTIWLPYDMDTLKIISKKLRPNYILLSAGVNRPYTPYKDYLWTHMFNDLHYARELGYELISVIKFQNLPVAFLFKPVD